MYSLSLAIREAEYGHAEAVVLKISNIPNEVDIFLKSYLNFRIKLLRVPNRTG